MNEKPRITVATDPPQDITDDVATMYDLLHGSMDWGSGFLDIEDVVAMVRVAGLCGFATPDQAGQSITAYLQSAQPFCPFCKAHKQFRWDDRERGRMSCGHFARVVFDEVTHMHVIDFTEDEPPPPVLPASPPIVKAKENR